MLKQEVGEKFLTHCLRNGETKQALKGLTRPIISSIRYGESVGSICRSKSGKIKSRVGTNCVKQFFAEQFLVSVIWKLEQIYAS